MAERDESKSPTIPPNPYGGHLAGRRWFTERYQTERSALEGHSVNQLRTIVERSEKRTGPTTSDQKAHDQAARDALTSRAKEMGLDPNKR